MNDASVRAAAIALSTIGAAMLSGSVGSSTMGCSSGGVGCNNGVDWRVTIEVPERTHALRVTVCRNGVCSESSFHSDGHVDATRGPFSVGVSLSPADGTSGRTITVHLGDRTSDLQDGDVYVFTLDDLTAARKLLEFTSKPVVYARRDNGDSECVHADLSP